MFAPSKDHCSKSSNATSQQSMSLKDKMKFFESAINKDTHSSAGKV